jgi:hypothetical protein
LHLGRIAALSLLVSVASVVITPVMSVIVSVATFSAASIAIVSSAAVSWAHKHLFLEIIFCFMNLFWI